MVCDSFAALRVALGRGGFFGGQAVRGRVAVLDATLALNALQL